MNLAAALTPRQFPRQRSVSIALLLALLGHVLLLLWLMHTSIATYAIPEDKTRIFPPFQVRRVDMNATSLKGSSDSLPEVTTPAFSPQPAPVFAPDGNAVEQALKANAPQLPFPATPQAPLAESPVTAPSAAGDSSPYTPSDQARISAEIAKFQSGPTGTGALLPGPGNISGLSGGNADAGTMAGSGTLNPGPTKPGQNGLPSFADLKADFKTPAAAVQPGFLEPVLLRLPSDIVFDFDSATLKPNADPLLLQARDFVLKYPAARIQVDGHTDTIGGDAYNQTLSEARAASVAAWLRQRLPSGDKYKIVSRGFGKTRPLVTPSGSAREQERNRRVEITIQGIAAP